MLLRKIRITTDSCIHNDQSINNEIYVQTSPMMP